MITETMLVDAVERFLIDEGFKVDRLSNSLAVDLHYGQWSHQHTTLSIDVGEYIGIYPPGTACLLKIPLADPKSFEVMVATIRRCHRELLARGIDDLWKSGWKFRLSNDDALVHEHVETGGVLDPVLQHIPKIQPVI